MIVCEQNIRFDTNYNYIIQLTVAAKCRDVLIFMQLIVNSEACFYINLLI